MIRDHRLQVLYTIHPVQFKGNHRYGLLGVYHLLEPFLKLSLQSHQEMLPILSEQVPLQLAYIEQAEL